MRPPNIAETTANPKASAGKAFESVLDDHPFLVGLKPQHLRLLKDSAMRMHYNVGEFIFREGEPANRFYLIEQGRVSLASPRKDIESVTVQIIGPGDVLGWSWLFPPYYWHFNARALEPTTAIFIYGTRLREQCERDSAFGYEMMKRMTQVVIHRLQATRKQLLSLRR